MKNKKEIRKGRKENSRYESGEYFLLVLLVIELHGGASAGVRAEYKTFQFDENRAGRLVYHGHGSGQFDPLRLHLLEEYLAR